ncbi:MAG: GNAT family protein [Bacteroidales bacterium]
MVTLIEITGQTKQIILSVVYEGDNTRFLDYKQIEYDLLYPSTSNKYFFITKKDISQAVVGFCALHHINMFHRFASLSFALYPMFTGKGYMKEALSKLFLIAFSQLHLNRIEAQVHEQNIKSCGLLQKLGFKKEGVLRNNFITQSGIYSSYMYGLLRDDFKDIK